ncbi:hypothetical protein KIPE111705_39805 [Kibdelosporangium persicum]|uniref:Uncharacterized protein n=1 Tax=Kibdelosporangium persicum TaxID=2698649 RepID=A0ABX2F6P2_9PSEU|nr:hypothetical protein [Kibdelosporangium persicum]NRN66824.1 hypothetical protein [Kibdelosporangium persicum]
MILRRFVNRLTGRRTPDDFDGTLEDGEYVIASAEVKSGGHMVATSRGLWLPGSRRVGWHMISKATWGGGTLVLIEAVEAAKAGDAVVLADQPPVRFVFVQSGKLPDIVHARVTKSIVSRHRQELPGGGAWFVQRRVPGQDGVVLQVRPDKGTDEAAVRRVAEEVAAKLRLMKPDLEQ